MTTNKTRFLHAVGEPTEPFLLYAVRTDTSPHREMFLAYPIARADTIDPYSRKPKLIPCTAEQLRYAVRNTIPKIQSVYGGTCHLEISRHPQQHEDHLSQPQRKQQAEQLILNGPDTPGRRWLLQKQANQPNDHIAKALPRL